MDSEGQVFGIKEVSQIFWVAVDDIREIERSSPYWIAKRQYEADLDRYVKETLMPFVELLTKRLC